MPTGKGNLNLRDGRGVEVEYQFASVYDDRRVGYLLLDTTALDDLLLGHRLVIDCEDGTSVVLVVTNRSDKHLAVHGRVLAPCVEAA
jgi:hypothetical protein